MKILAIGDPHGRIPKKLPKNVDIILITGDIGNADLARKLYFKRISGEINEKTLRRKAFFESYNSCINILKKLSKKARVFFVFGNVEYPNNYTKKVSKEIGFRLPYLSDAIRKIKNVRVINNKLVKLSGIKIIGIEYFSDVCWVKTFKPSDYNKKLKEARRETLKIRKFLKKFGKADILLCHQPPYGILDRVNFPNAPKHWQGKHAGSKVILDYIKRYKPKYVFCGHIHEGKGMKRIRTTEVYNLGVAGFKLVEFN